MFGWSHEFGCSVVCLKCQMWGSLQNYSSVLDSCDKEKPHLAVAKRLHFPVGQAKHVEKETDTAQGQDRNLVF